MSEPAIINITLDAFCIVICVILMICMRLGNAKRGLDKLFFALLTTLLAVLISSLMSWLFDGKTGEFAYAFLIAVNFLLYFFWYILRAKASCYVFLYISQKSMISRKYLAGICGFCVLSVVLLIISQFTGLIYRIDENNIFRRSELYWIAYILPILQYLLDLVMISRYRKNLGKKDIIALLTFELLPVFSLAIQIPLFGVMLLNSASTVALLILYVGIQIENNKRLELELSNCRIDIMLSQIQSHFLYNTLSAIAALCEKSPKAKQAVIDFAVYLRGNMDSITANKPIPFEKELKHIEVYLNLEKMRFGDELNIAYNIGATGFTLPPLTMQPIVENAVKYGVGKKEGGGTVTLSTAENDDSFIVTVHDDGVGFDPTETPNNNETHIGIENVRSRLKSQCGGTLIIASEIGTGTTVTINIPKGG